MFFFGGDAEVRFGATSDGPAVIKEDDDEKQGRR
jgi:hypothetical protein